MSALALPSVDLVFRAAPAQLAELMGGSVVLESTLDVGSTFTVRIPFKKATTADNAAASPVPLALEPGRDGRPEKSAVRLLLAEGEHDGDTRGGWTRP